MKEGYTPEEENNTTSVQPEVNTQVTEPVMTEPVQQPSIDNPTQVVEQHIQPTVTQPEEKKKTSCLPIIIIVVIVVILAIIGLVVGLILLGNNKGSNGDKGAINNNDNITTTTAAAEKPCNIEKDHIHLSDLSKEEMAKLKIDYNNLYTDSEVKSIIFNGKEYDYDMLVSAVTDFDKMTDLISSEDKMVVECFDEATKTTTVKNTLTKAEVEKKMTYFTDYSYSTGISETFHVLSEGETPTSYNTSDRFIKVSWDWDYGDSVLTKVGDVKIADKTRYGQHHGSKDYIILSHTSAFYNSINEDFGIVLKDGRYVHYLESKDYSNGKSWHLEYYIYVMNQKYEERG